MTILNIVFDLDGTLVDSAEDILAALRQAAEEARIQSDVPLTTAVIGPPVRGMLSAWGAEFTAEQAEVAVLAFRRIYDSSTMPRTVPYAGIAQCIDLLRASGCRLFVATNKPTLPTGGLLKRYFAGAFEDFCCTDSLQNRRLDKFEMLTELERTHDLRREDSVMVGDSESDLRAGKAIGWRTLAALYGYGTTEVLRSEQPDWEVSAPSQIADLLLSSSSKAP